TSAAASSPTLRRLRATSATPPSPSTNWPSTAWLRNTTSVTTRRREFVWLCIDGKAHKTFVRTGGFTANGVRVTEGLKPGDRIITDGSQKISENTLLQIQ
ncbi:MAG: hypothetical protein IIU04_03710, partial [Bacteroidales bacterium]|nr:hypothetical protein [Bacteroidales bacterium]